MLTGRDVTVGYLWGIKDKNKSIYHYDKALMHQIYTAAMESIKFPFPNIMKSIEITSALQISAMFNYLDNSSWASIS